MSTPPKQDGSVEEGQRLEGRSVPASDARDPAYFHYYAQFVHQQNMLQDNVRTSAYHSAIMVNAAAFRDKLVMDLGAGSGILSYFAVQAGAQKVYAVEASGMSHKIQKLLDSADTKNTWMKNKLEVISAKVENATAPKVDTLISEPIGVLLVHERMIESYLVARDRFLKPGGVMIPSSGNIYLAPFTDANLWTQTMTKVRFWEQTNFYGVDFCPLALDAREEIFGQPVVGIFDRRILLAAPSSYAVDFETISMEELQDFVIPFTFQPAFTGIVHGIAGWFDINLGGLVLNTGPQADRTHWQQVRFLLKEPLAVNAFDTITGWMRLTVNESRSYDIVVELTVGDGASLATPSNIGMADAALLRSQPGGHGYRRGQWALHEQTYMYEQTLDYSQPEFLSMYTPENAAVLQNVSDAALDEVAWTSAGLVTPVDPAIIASGAPPQQ
ncbi:S-adenosyl-L-methionine-dependent methyltransferase [Gaertneriomyces semiglobifer]|nr:S-adenosyl-L-methionine-dependent methyltransferase [Gaertneriomyces semiglobifer]